MLNCFDSVRARTVVFFRCRICRPPSSTILCGFVTCGLRRRVFDILSVMIIKLNHDLTENRAKKIKRLCEALYSPKECIVDEHVEFHGFSKQEITLICHLTFLFKSLNLPLHFRSLMMLRHLILSLPGNIYCRIRRRDSACLTWSDTIDL